MWLYRAYKIASSALGKKKKRKKLIIKDFGEQLQLIGTVGEVGWEETKKLGKSNKPRGSNPPHDRTQLSSCVRGKRSSLISYLSQRKTKMGLFIYFMPLWAFFFSENVLLHVVSRF